MSVQHPARRRRSRADSSRPSHVPVAVKLAVVIAALAVVVMGVLGAILMNQHTRTLQDQAERFGETMAHQLASASAELVLAEDRMALGALVNNLAASDVVRGAAIFTLEGIPLAEAGVHRGNPGEVTSWGQGWRWRLPASDEPVAAWQVPIRFQDVAVGHARVTHSLAPLEATTRRAIWLLVSATLVMALLASLAAGVIGKRLSRPIDHLMDASRAIGAGDYGFRFTERRNDEIGHLMESFNHMARGLLEKSQVESALSRYVSPGVARQVLSNLDLVQLGGRHVEATVMFADIVGFTRLSERLPPAEVADLLNEYFGLITRIATDCHGNVDKFIGDGAMMVFGVTEPDPDHRLHGVLCAIMLQRLISRLNRKGDALGRARVEFRVGINSGPMLAGNLGASERMQYTVVGDAVNLASRLMSIAEPGEVVAPQELAADPRVARFVLSRNSRQIRVRGRDEPVLTCCLGSRGDDPELDRRIDALLTPEATS